MTTRTITLNKSKDTWKIWLFSDMKNWRWCKKYMMGMDLPLLRRRVIPTNLKCKTQHKRLRKTSVGDFFALTLALRVVESLFDEFRFGWIGDEIFHNLPKELEPRRRQGQ